MHALSISAALVSALIGTVSAKTIHVQVGHNTTADPGVVFQPQRVTASLGDTVVFNFTQGNHTVTQSTFSAPCVPAHETNITINGFDSSFRDAGDGTAVTTLLVPILPDNMNLAIWFFDYNTCGAGGVGVINNNETSDETLDGFERNAIRLNGSESVVSSSTWHSTGTGSAPLSVSTTNDGQCVVALGRAVVLPIILAALSL